MESPRRPARTLLGVLLVSISFSQAWAADARRVIEAYPDAVKASMEIYQRQLEATAAGNGAIAPFYVIVRQVQRWKPGATVRVSFNGGSDALYTQIRDAASAWTVADGANLKLVFTDANGRFLKWTSQDHDYKGEIRIGFETGANGGFWSMVGTDSVAPALVGGNPYQASMNLEGFDKQLPADWRAVVMHEFGHALGFHHEHQSPAGGCDFRFEDDPGYVRTVDEFGWYTTDENNRRPGLYTFLGGKANYWPRAKVDHNLRALPNGSAFLTSGFDRLSIMKYFFDGFVFIAGDQSPCFTRAENHVLSALDLEGARRVYPHEAPAMNAVTGELTKVLEQVRSSPRASPQLRDHVNNRLKMEMGQ